MSPVSVLHGSLCLFPQQMFYVELMSVIIFLLKPRTPDETGCPKDFTCFVLQVSAAHQIQAQAPLLHTYIVPFVTSALPSLPSIDDSVACSTSLFCCLCAICFGSYRVIEMVGNGWTAAFNIFYNMYNCAIVM